MAGIRFWSAPGHGHGLPVPGTSNGNSARPAHKRTRSNIDPHHRTGLSSTYTGPLPGRSNLHSVLAAGSVCVLIFLLSTPSAAAGRNPGRTVQEPGYLKDSFLDALVKCENGAASQSSRVCVSDRTVSYGASRHQVPCPDEHPARYSVGPEQTTSAPRRARLATRLSEPYRQRSCVPAWSRVPLSPSLDVVWTWTNGSDPLHFRARRIAEMSEPRFVQEETPRGRNKQKEGAEDKLFREHDELRHSIRSVLDNFHRWSTRFQVLAADFPFPSCNLTHSRNTLLGQIPQWLNNHNSKDGSITLDVVHHSQFMSDYRQPTFSSIESQLTNLNLSEAFIYMLTALFFECNLTSWYPHDKRDQKGVWRMANPAVLKHASRYIYPHGIRGVATSLTAIIGDRFGQRYRPYTTHEAKTLVKSMVDEVSITWHSQLHYTGQQRFRMNPEAKDAYLPFLTTHWIVERHREALLWAWVVARIGGDDDEWGPVQSAQAWKELGGAADSDLVDVRRQVRTTLQEDRVMNVLDSTGDTAIGRTQYAFVSRDGYPYASLGRFGWKNWPLFQPSKSSDKPGMYSDPGARCTIKRTECLGASSPRIRGASGIFARLAFEVPHCGDCVITALVATSGDLGFSAFLPGSGRVWTPWKDPEQEPPKEIAPTYRLSQTIARPIFLWLMYLRTGLTPSHFAMLKNPNSIKALFERLENKIHAEDTIQDALMLCLNDDITLQPERADKLLRDWQGQRWPQKAGWEL
ncbi:N-acetylglucosamine-1-phosphate transferase alpha and beta subunits [Rhizoctonia solani]|uniref:N-acetylglucosamine-1-phosphate transferase alpha and beta subunits n=1 Tax=Rhizoctonia solani TaxID=456999 RepID=A0A8H7IJ24_9AGAM|nr:N-acetylglucosamine-1-phosphate transferase alpha and beta subunits [Rhizoctonia solani]